MCLEYGKNPHNLVYVFAYTYVLQRLKKYDLAEKYYEIYDVVLGKCE